MAKKTTTKATPKTVEATEEIKTPQVEETIQEETPQPDVKEGELELINDELIENRYEELTSPQIAEILDKNDNTKIIVIGEERKDATDLKDYVVSFIVNELKLKNSNLIVLSNDSEIKFVGTSPDAFRGYDPDYIVFTNTKTIDEFYEKYDGYLQSLRGRKIVYNNSLTDDERYAVYLYKRIYSNGLTTEQHDWLKDYIVVNGKVEITAMTEKEMENKKSELKTRLKVQFQTETGHPMINDITKFMTVMKQYVGSSNTMPSVKNIKLRRDLALEELNETRDAFNKIEATITGLLTSGKTANFDELENIDLIVELMDGFIDQLVILAGTGITYGTTRIHDLFNDILEAFLTGNNNIEVPDTNKNLITRVYPKFKNIEDSIELLYTESLQQYLLGNTQYHQSGFHIGNILINILESMKILGVDNKEMLQEIWNEIQRANMSKLDENGEPVFLPSGKVTKSKLYKAPELKPIVEKYINK